MVSLFEAKSRIVMRSEYSAQGILSTAIKKNGSVLIEKNKHYKSENKRPDKKRFFSE